MMWLIHAGLGVSPSEGRGVLWGNAYHFGFTRASVCLWVAWNSQSVLELFPKDGAQNTHRQLSGRGPSAAPGGHGWHFTFLTWCPLTPVWWILGMGSLCPPSRFWDPVSHFLCVIQETQRAIGP